MKIRKNEQLYLLAFAIYLVKEFLGNTMFAYSLPPIVLQCLKWSSLILVLFKICFDRYHKQKMLIVGIVFILISLSSYISTYKSLFIFLIFIIGAKNVEFKKIVKVYFYLILPLLIFTIISSKLGIVEDLVYYQNGVFRHSFGVSYPTDFAAYIFYLMVAYIYIKNNQLPVVSYLLMLIIAILVYNFCHARLDVGCMIILLFTSLLIRYNKINFKSKLVKICLVCSFLFCSLFMISITYNYDWTNSFHAKIDSILSGRLTIGRKNLDKYDIKLFGQQIDDHGFGGNLTFEYEETDYIDCSYLRILLKYGLITFTFLLFASLLFNFQLYKNGHYLLLALIFIISINSIVAQHYMDFSYNITLFAMFAILDKKKEVVVSEKI